MKMAFISRVGLGLAAALVLSGSAFAARVAPADYQFILKGGGNLNQPSNIWPCGWTFQMKTGPSIGGTLPRASARVVRRAVGDNVNASASSGGARGPVASPVPKARSSSSASYCAGLSTCG